MAGQGGNWGLLLGLLLAYCNLASCRHLAGAPRPPTQPNLWGLVQNRSDLKTFSRLVQGAGLVPLLNQSSSSLTVFMPVDDAFTAFFEEFGSNITELLNYSQTLQDILLYHMCPYHVLSDSSMHPNMTLTMASGDNLTISSSWDGSMVIRDAAGRTADFLDWNLVAGEKGIGHTIDRVLFPFRPLTINEALSFNTQFSTFQQLLLDANYTALLNSSSANVTLLVPTNDAFLAALQSMNMTYQQLVANCSLVQSLVNVHILPAVVSLEYLAEFAGAKYFPTCNSCSTFYAVQDYETGDLILNGMGNTADQVAMIVEGDLYAGQHALIHVLDAVMLPLKKWGWGCHYTGQAYS